MSWLKKLIPGTNGADDGNATVAKLGSENKMYYCSERKRWVERGREAEMDAELAKANAPPPLPTFQRKSAESAAPPPSNSRYVDSFAAMGLSKPRPDASDSAASNTPSFTKPASLFIVPPNPILPDALLGPSVSEISTNVASVVAPPSESPAVQQQEISDHSYQLQEEAALPQQEGTSENPEISQEARSGAFSVGDFQTDERTFGDESAMAEFQDERNAEEDRDHADCQRFCVETEMYSFGGSEISSETLDYLVYVIREVGDETAVRAALGTLWNISLANKSADFSELAVHALEVWGERSAAVVRAAAGILRVSENFEFARVAAVVSRLQQSLSDAEDERIHEALAQVAVRCVVRGGGEFVASEALEKTRWCRVLASK